MSLAKGIDSHIGYGAEVTNGSAGTIDLFARIVSESLQHVKDPFVNDELNADWLTNVFYSAGRNQGSVVFNTIYTGLELFWHSLFGTYAFTADSPVVGAHTHTFSFDPTTNAFPPGITIEAVRGIGGTREQKFLGMHATKATIEFAARQILRTTFDFLGTGVSFGAATAATFPTSKPILPAHKTTLSLGGASLTVLSGTLEMEVPRADSREHYGEALYKEAVVSGRPSATFSLLCEQNDGSGADTDQLVQDYHDETEIAGLVLIHQGDIITGATKYQSTITGTKAFITAAFPSAQNPGINQVTIDGTITTGLTHSLVNATGSKVS